MWNRRKSDVVRHWQPLTFGRSQPPVTLGALPFYTHTHTRTQTQMCAHPHFGTHSLVYTHKHTHTQSSTHFTHRMYCNWVASGQWYHLSSIQIITPCALFLLLSPIKCIVERPVAWVLRWDSERQPEPLQHQETQRHRGNCRGVF